MPAAGSSPVWFQQSPQMQAQYSQQSLQGAGPLPPPTAPSTLLRHIMSHLTASGHQHVLAQASHERAVSLPGMHAGGWVGAPGVAAAVGALPPPPRLAGLSVPTGAGAGGQAPAVSVQAAGQGGPVDLQLMEKVSESGEKTRDA